MEIYLHDISDLSIIPQLWLTVKLDPLSQLNTKTLAIFEQRAQTQLADLIEIIVPIDSPHKKILSDSQYSAGLSSYVLVVNSRKSDSNQSIKPVSLNFKIETLLPLLHQQAAYHHQLNPQIYNQPKQINWQRYFKIFNDHILKTRDPIFVYEKAQKPIGMLSTFTTNKQLNVWDLIVDKNHRGSGIGKVLVNSARSYCQKTDIASINLEAWTQSTTLHNFYSNLGFKCTAQSWYKIRK